SLCFRSNAIACRSCRKVTFAPGGPETEMRLLLIFAGDAEHAFIAARNATFAASKAVPSKPVYGCAPFTSLVQAAWKALPAGPPAALAAVPESPTTGWPIPSRVGPSFSASVMSVFVASHLPLRTSEGTNFTNVWGKSMITQPSGFHAMFTPTLPPSAFHCATKSCSSAVPKASLRAPTLMVAPLPNFSSAACASTFPCSVSDGYARQTYPLSASVEISGALAVGEMRTMWFGIVTDCAIGIVAPEAISPMITSTCSPTSFLAASTEAAAWVCPSCESTSTTLIFFESPAFLSAAFCSWIASRTALSMLPPYAARRPVNGSTVPIRSVNEQFAACEDAGDAVAVSAARIPAPASTTATRVSLLHLTTGLLLSVLRLPPGAAAHNVATLTDISRKGKESGYARRGGCEGSRRFAGRRCRHQAAADPARHFRSRARAGVGHLRVISRRGRARQL